MSNKSNSYSLKKLTLVLFLVFGFLLLYTVNVKAKESITFQNKERLYNLYLGKNKEKHNVLIKEIQNKDREAIKGIRIFVDNKQVAKKSFTNDGELLGVNLSNIIYNNNGYVIIFGISENAYVTKAYTLSKSNKKITLKEIKDNKIHKISEIYKEGNKYYGCANTPFNMPTIQNFIAYIPLGIKNYNLDIVNKKEYKTYLSNVSNKMNNFRSTKTVCGYEKPNKHSPKSLCFPKGTPLELVSIRLGKSKTDKFGNKIYSGFAQFKKNNIKFWVKCTFDEKSELDKTHVWG